MTRYYLPRETWWRGVVFVLTFGLWPRDYPDADNASELRRIAVERDMHRRERL